MVTRDVTYSGRLMKQISMDLGAAVHSLARARYTKRQRDALTIARCLREVMDPRDAERLASTYAATAADPDANRWTFAMISPAQNAAVVRWLSAHSKRPQKAAQLWAELFTALHPATGEIMLDRDALAARIDIEPRTVSELMGELSRSTLSLDQGGAEGPVSDEPWHCDPPAGPGSAR